MSGLGSGSHDGPVALMDGTSPLAHRTDSRAPPHADAQRPESPHRVPATPSGPFPAEEWAPRPLRASSHLARPLPAGPPSFGRFVSVGRPVAPPYTSKGLPRSQGDSVPRSTVEKASTIRGTVAPERRVPRDSISAKPSHAPVPASRRCASCRHASEGGTIGDHASGLPPGGLGRGTRDAIPRIPGRLLSLRAGPETYAGVPFSTPKCERPNAGIVFIAVLD